jgi:hypothetical protein
MLFRSTILRSLLGLVLAASVYSPIALASFPDVVETHPEAEYIEKLQEIYAISGFEDNGFHPEEPITRAGVIKVAMQASNHVAEVIDSNYKLSYKDLKSEDPITGYIEAAVKLGILSGDGTTDFRPNDPATRAEGLKIVLSAFEITPPPVERSSFSDVEDDAWYKPYAEFAYQYKLIRTTGTSFLPNNSLKRSELARMVATIYIAKEEPPIKTLPMELIIAMGILWLLFAIPLALYFIRHIKKVWLKSLLAILAIILGPIGSLALSLMRIVTTRVKVSNGDGVPSPQRRRLLRKFNFFVSRRHARIAAKWADQIQLSVLSVILSVGYLIILIDLIGTSVATMQSREALAIFLNG